MIICALQGFQRSINADESYCFSTISELSNNYENVMSVQRLEISLRSFSYSYSAVAISLMKTKINKSKPRLFDCEVPRSSILFGTRRLVAINFKGGRGKNFVYSRSFSGHGECFAIRWMVWFQRMFSLTVLWFQAQPWRWWLSWVTRPFFHAPSPPPRFAKIYERSHKKRKHTPLYGQLDRKIYVFFFWWLL